jgi:hypothetical protein
MMVGRLACGVSMHAGRSAVRGVMGGQASTAGEGLNVVSFRVPEFPPVKSEARSMMGPVIATRRGSVASGRGTACTR